MSVRHTATAKREKKILGAPSRKNAPFGGSEKKGFLAALVLKVADDRSFLRLKGRSHLTNSPEADSIGETTAGCPLKEPARSQYQGLAGNLGQHQLFTPLLLQSPLQQSMRQCC